MGKGRLYRGSQWAPLLRSSTSRVWPSDTALYVPIDLFDLADLWGHFSDPNWPSLTILLPRKLKQILHRSLPWRATGKMAIWALYWMVSGTQCILNATRVFLITSSVYHMHACTAWGHLLHRLESTFSSKASSFDATVMKAKGTVVLSNTGNHSLLSIFCVPSIRLSFDTLFRLPLHNQPSITTLPNT